jgi:mannose-6-phosphate isomerase-like protein (cupin superfamily)
MIENKLKININVPVSEVFSFTINPQNTHLWIDFVAEETIDSKEIKLGTHYTNRDKDGNINIYELTQFENNTIFELQSVPPYYTVKYTYTPISDTETELEYFEWVESGELSSPFPMSAMQKLKEVLELNEDLKGILKNEGYPIVYEWIDEPGTVYENHKHQGKVSFFVTEGSVTFSGGINKTVSKGQRIDVPVGVEHSAVVGEKGCSYIVGQEIEGDA